MRTILSGFVVSAALITMAEPPSLLPGALASGPQRYVTPAPCPPRLDHTARTATIRALAYVVAADGRPVPIGGGCSDTDADVLMLETTRDGCDGLFVVDFEALRATETMRMVYTHPSFGLKTAFECGVRPDSRSFELFESIERCRMEHDFDGGRTEALVVWVFSVDGTLRRAGGCAGGDDGRSRWYDHIYEGCDPLDVVDPDTSQPVLINRSRTLIPTTPPLEIVSCQPSEEGADSLLRGAIAASGPGGRSTWDPAEGGGPGLDGCDGIFVHDVRTNASYGTRRWYRLTDDGKPSLPASWQPITDCVQNPYEAYRHAYVFDGWRHDDARRLSWALTRVEVRTDVGVEVLDSDLALYPPVRHVLLATATEPEPSTAFELGCETWAFQAILEDFERPDHTRHTRLMGYGPARRLAGC